MTLKLDQEDIFEILYENSLLDVPTSVLSSLIWWYLSGLNSKGDFQRTGHEFP